MPIRVNRKQSGGGGGGALINADSGLSVVGGNTAVLGSPLGSALLQNAVILLNAFLMEIDGATTSWAMTDTSFRWSENATVSGAEQVFADGSGSLFLVAGAGSPGSTSSIRIGNASSGAPGVIILYEDNVSGNLAGIQDNPLSHPGILIYDQVHHVGLIGTELFPIHPLTTPDQYLQVGNAASFVTAAISLFNQNINQTITLFNIPGGNNVLLRVNATMFVSNGASAIGIFLNLIYTDDAGTVRTVTLANPAPAPTVAVATTPQVIWAQKGTPVQIQISFGVAMIYDIFGVVEYLGVKNPL